MVCFPGDDSHTPTWWWCRVDPSHDVGYPQKRRTPVQRPVVWDTGATQQSVPPGVARAFSDLAALVYSGANASEALDAVVRVTAQVMPGADHVSISVLEGEAQLRTLAATDYIARLMDELESEARQGPCVDSILHDSVQRDDDIAVASTWPELAKLTLERTPVRGMVGYQLLHGDNGRAALNVFSDTPGALTAEAATSARCWPRSPLGP